MIMLIIAAGLFLTVPVLFVSCKGVATSWKVGIAVALLSVGVLFATLVALYSADAAKFAADCAERYEAASTYHLIDPSVSAAKSCYNREVIDKKKMARNNPFLLDKSVILDIPTFPGIFPEEKNE